MTLCRKNSWIAMVAGIGLLVGCRADSELSGVASTISVIVGNNQSAMVGAGISVEPIVEVRDATGRGVAGVTVKFSVISGGGSVTGDSAVTDGAGHAHPESWSLGTTPGSNALRAALPRSAVSTIISATATVGAAVAIESTGPTQFVAIAGQAVSPLPAVVVHDEFGNPVPGVTVTFTVTEGGGSITSGQSSTDQNGMAAVGSWTLGAEPGTNVLAARLPSGTQFIFSAQALSSEPSIAAASPTTQNGYLTFQVPNIPRVLVTDGGGQPLVGVPVTFSQIGDGLLIGGAAITDQQGMASPTDWRLGNGPSTVTATTPLGGAPITFSAVGVAPSFRIDVRFLTPVNADDRDAFVAAASRWMQIITAHLSSVTVDLPGGACATQQPAMHESVEDLVIFAEISSIDGAGGVLGSASPCVERSTNSLPVVANMEFDTEDLADLERTGLLLPTITHEMGHALGFGTVWTADHLLAGGGGDDPTFVGTQALATWPPFATGIGYAGAAVPVENCGGAGTADAHWREATTCNGSTPVFGAELMTGYIEAPGVAMPISRMTVAALQDLGYQVNYGAADVFAGNLVAPRSLAMRPPKRIDERLGTATWRVTPDGTTHRIP